MPGKKTDINILKKIKKDGSIDPDFIMRIASALSDEEMVINTVDSIYGLMCIIDSPYADSIQKYSNEKEEKIELLVSDFRMLETVATITKFEFDFLHRVWPGEITIHLHDKNDSSRTIPMRIPKSKFQRSIISLIKKPLLYGALYNKKGKHVYREKEIIKTYKNKVKLITIIKDYCKEHVMPSIVDISKNNLNILKEGRVPEEEIKSLYFIGADDVSENLFY